ncbi:MAG: hypothetical protein K2X37_02350 [Chitinophagaceae bacterium]|nr:hypothetical protein [Chitinophagaceae bacterium]
MRYRCRNCEKTRVENYTYEAYQSGTNQKIITYTKEGLSIRSTARILKISTSTLLSRIILISKNVRQPAIPKGKIFQVDEMRTYIREKFKLTWIVYALEQETKNIVSFNVGRRTNNTLKK